MQVWVKPELRDGKLYWQADSDSALTKASIPAVLFLAAPPLQPPDMPK